VPAVRSPLPSEHGHSYRRLGLLTRSIASRARCRRAASRRQKWRGANLTPFGPFSRARLRNMRAPRRARPAMSFVRCGWTWLLASVISQFDWLTDCPPDLHSAEITTTTASSVRRTYVGTTKDTSAEERADHRPCRHDHRKTNSGQAQRNFDRDCTGETPIIVGSSLQRQTCPPV